MTAAPGRANVSSKPYGLPEAMPPRVLIRYLAASGEARQRAEELSKVLSQNGFEVADVRDSSVALSPELNFYYTPDLLAAQRVGRLAGLPAKRAVVSRDGLTMRPGTIALDLSGR